MEMDDELRSDSIQLVLIGTSKEHGFCGVAFGLPKGVQLAVVLKDFR